MSNSPQGLNLIERAVKRLGESVVKAEPAEALQPLDPILAPTPVQVRRAPPAPAVRTDASDDGMLGDVPAPQVSVAADAQSASRKDVTLNFAKFRQDQIIAPDNPVSTTQEEFRAVKRKLLLAARDGKADGLSRNVVMVTSALPGEGKTFTAINLAMSLASERNLQVLLIDADVVKPSMQEFFRGNDKNGLTELLNGSVQRISDVVHRVAEVPNLSIMFAGQHDIRSPELMASRRMGEIFAELSARYPDRIIVLDSPPAVVSSEPTALAMHVHQIIMVVAAEQASRHHVEEALERVSACRHISLLFNKSPHWRKGGSSYYYYGNRNKDAGAPAA